MSNTHVGYNNYIIGAVLTSTSAEPNLPVENLQNDIGAPSVAWQTLTTVTTASFTVTPPIAGLPWRLFGLFRTNLTAAASVTFALYTGVSTLVWTTTVTGPVAGYGQVIAIAAANQTADYLVVTIADPTNPDGFLNVPLAFAGPAWVPAVGFSWQTAFGRDSLTDELVSRGGQEYPEPRWQRRRWDIALNFIAGSELWADAQSLDAVSRSGGNALFIADSASSYLKYEAIFGRLESLADVQFVSGVTSLYAWRFRVKERL